MGDKMLFRIFIVVIFAMFIFAVFYGEKRNLENKENKVVFVEACYVDDCQKFEIETNASNLYEFLDGNEELSSTLEYNAEAGIYKIYKIAGYEKSDGEFWMVEKQDKDEKYNMLEIISLKNISIEDDESYRFLLK